MIPVGLTGWVIKGGVVVLVVGGIWYHGYAFNGNRLTKKYLTEKNAAMAAVVAEKQEILDANSIVADRLSEILKGDSDAFNGRVSTESERLRKYYAAKFVLPAERTGTGTGRDLEADLGACKRAAQASLAEIARLADEVVVAEEAALLCSRGASGVGASLKEIESRGGKR